ncbi:MAG: NAD(P)H-dependent oxidoreductase [Bacilli bacterium]|nr:NAD(P)H-dependent oxidoreductase [Bacilli bacterium]
MKIIGLCGSARKKSYNRAVLQYIKENHKENIELEILDLTTLPMYNQDLESDLPKEVIEYVEKLKQADGFVIITPEYNYSIPALLKNALDWGSRSREAVFDSKPACLMSASLSIFGGARVQYHLRQVLVCLNVITMNKPEVFISKASEKIDENGNITDAYTKEKVLGAFHTFINGIKKES